MSIEEVLEHKISKKEEKTKKIKILMQSFWHGVTPSEQKMINLVTENNRKLKKKGSWNDDDDTCLKKKRGKKEFLSKT
ncbi:hypothetical protein HK099_002516, partial [Clydaea vesicula]